MAHLLTSSYGFAVWAQGQPVAALLITLLVVSITTRLITGRSAGSQTQAHGSGARTPPAVPYWVPYLGHIPQLVLNGAGFLTRSRKSYPGGTFSLNLLSRTYTVLYRPDLIKALLNKSQDVADTKSASKRLLQTVFGYPRSKTDVALYDKFCQDADDQDKHLSDEASLSLLVDKTATRLRHNIADFVTFSSGEIDQAPWERMAEAGLVDAADQTDVVEADLFELVRNFVSVTANAALLGIDFVECFPDFWQGLWRLDKGVLPLAMETPSLLPVNAAIGARRARGFLLGWMDEFERALDAHHKGESPGPQWADLDNVSSIIKGRLENVWLKHRVPIKQRSCMDLSLIWALNANTNPLIFWIVWRIYSDAWLLIKIREEIEPYVVVENAAPEFGSVLHTAVRIEKFDLEGLLQHCPYLKASYIESLRLDVDVWDLKAIKQDTVITSKEDGSAFSLQAGTYALGASALHYTDATAFDDPLSWKPERHITWTGTDDAAGKKKAVVDMSKLAPYSELSWPDRRQPGGRPLTHKPAEGEQLGLGKDFAIREIVLFSAAIIAMYDMQPPYGAPWKLPKQATTAGAKHPLTTTRVWITLRPT